ncbi:hypothetical protein FM076_29295 [Streptomyces albus subsp. chlorinus]|uniref:hypothetical protein n=1 Tax=Streptomyces albus TaxID=1888 RepID=UPI001571399B|nr:hypothetical protein [Streptomyces albus]NSC25032.1 hypothetical protein [Streptomyces albus subsp. chlorinus]
MVTILFVVGLVVVLAVSTGLAFRSRQEAARDGQGLSRRFGPEYDRALARHQGDARAAVRELRTRLKRYGALAVLPLDRNTRERYLDQWAAVQEDFADAPQRALSRAEDLLTRLAVERGYPADVPFEERAAALSVHHARRVHGYRRVHEAGRVAGGFSTEEMRAALVEGRALFDSLLNARASALTAPAPRRATGTVRPRVS